MFSSVELTYFIPFDKNWTHLRFIGPKKKSGKAFIDPFWTMLSKEVPIQAFPGYLSLPLAMSTLDLSNDRQINPYYIFFHVPNQT